MTTVDPVKSKVLQKFSTESVTWLLENWSKDHEILVAGEPACLMIFKDPKLKLQYFLKPTEKTISDGTGIGRFLYYSLCVELLESVGKGVVSINAKFPADPNGYYAASPRDCKLNLNGWRNGIAKVVIEDFLFVKYWYTQGGERIVNSPASNWQYIFNMMDLTFIIEAKMFQLSGMRSDIATESNGMENQKEVDVNMMAQLKNMYAEEENFSDLKLETKDNMTLSAHKFQLSARSLVFRKIIEAEVKKNGFDGTIKIPDVNAKALIVILHWIYTGELHENLGKVMEEVVEAAVKYQLVDLLKTVDKKVIEICTTENMFQLFQVAKKIPMPTAIEDISGFIKEHL